MSYEIKHLDLWRNVVATELARAAIGDGPADFYEAITTYQRLAEERDRKEHEMGQQA
ncbi:hypothetical protein [Pseudaminobacter sp. NGMCC 1.201702]|uniref:hypothetical protein n=1 Tax=Pseudaminobacter sp. NGMCC 1.201702 TaxID=3391825 RepID=UPI0039EF3129